jgi:hypothetical protein
MADNPIEAGQRRTRGVARVYDAGRPLSAYREYPTAT